MTKDEIKKHLRRCYSLAAKSPDPSNQNGSLILDSLGYIVSVGFNTFPEGTTYTIDQIDNREWKLFHIEHAERNAIYPLVGEPISGSPIMVCPWFACSDCARAIVQSGIQKIIGHKERMDMTPDRWKDSVEAGLDIIRNGGVEIEFYSGKIGGSPIIVNGELWVP